MGIGEKIHELRTAMNLTLEQLGDLCGVGKSTVRKWENGMISDIRQTNLAKLAKALGTTPEELMGWTKYEQQLSEEVKLIEQIQAKYGKAAVEMLSVFVQLNDAGQAKAIDTIQDLTDVPKYRKDDEQ